LFPDVCAKAGNGFVTRPNCFVVPKPTKQSAERFNEFRYGSVEPIPFGGTKPAENLTPPSAEGFGNQRSTIRASNTIAVDHWPIVTGAEVTIGDPQ
jgi:hypothetical protein